MGLGQKFLTRVGSSQVSHLWFGIGKFPLKTSNFTIFSLQVKKISSSWVKKYPGQRWVCLLFTAGQKYAWLDQGSSLPGFKPQTQFLNVNS